MAGKLTLESLKAAAEAGEIDTVLVALVDMQGRLMGKRFHVDFFLESAFEETHSCNYLLATDMEMFTVEGYRATSRPCAAFPGWKARRWFCATCSTTTRMKTCPIRRAPS
jgi:glutamine synthetase